MIKFTVMYPDGEGKHFDMDYYMNVHLAASRKNPLVKQIVVEKGISSLDPGTKPPFAYVVHIYYESEEIYRSVFEPRREMLLKDIPNFTDIVPMFQISEVRALK